MEKADAVFQEELKVMHFFYGPEPFLNAWSLWQLTTQSFSRFPLNEKDLCHIQRIFAAALEHGHWSKRKMPTYSHTLVWTRVIWRSSVK